MLKRNKHDERRRDNLVAMPSLGDSDNIPPPTKDQISAFLANLGRKGGKIGGKRRLETMSAKERSRVAKKAAKARWARRSE